MRGYPALTLTLLAALPAAGCQSLYDPATIDVTDSARGLAEVDRVRWFREINALDTLKNKKLTGDGVTVTIMGEMVDAVHPDLSNAVSRQYNTWLQKGSVLAGEGNQPVGAERLTVDDGHGTHIAGILAAACDGAGIQGLACRAKLEAYSLGAYDSEENWPTAGWGEVDRFEQFVIALTYAFDDIARRKSSQIVTGSFNLESPALRYSPSSALQGKSISQIVTTLESRADSLDDLYRKGLVRFERTADQAILDRAIAKNDNDESIALMSFLPLSRQWEELENAIVRYQKTGGVYLVTESNYDFEGHSSTLNALPSLSNKLDKDLLLSVVMVQPEESSDPTGARPENLSAERRYSLPLNSCGELAADYCILTPSWSILSTMTPRVAFRDAGPLIVLDGRTHQLADGHSMGAPMVAAALALMEENNRKHHFGYTMKDLVRILKDSADRSFPGYNPKRHGRGLLDVDAAIAAMGAGR